MIKIDVIFSINIYEDINFLLVQIENIKKYVDLNYIIILNTNIYMKNKLKDSKILNKIKNIKINPISFNKKRFHGSLTKGIYSNMKFGIEKYVFNYFIILSSRNLFYNKLNLNNYNNLQKNTKALHFNDLNIKEWHWPSFIKTELSNYIINNNLKLSRSPHEGLTFDFLTCKKIIKFLDKNDIIKNNLFNWNSCVEEFALQTLSINLSGYYYDIGNGIETYYGNIKNLPKNRYVYKVDRRKYIKEMRKNKIIKKKLNILFIIFIFIFIYYIYYFFL